MENIEIAKALSQVADLLEIQKSNPFRIRAYRNAARFVADYASPMRKLLAEGADLTQFPGIGKDMSQSIRDLVETRSLVLLEELSHKVPRSLILIMRLPGVGPKKARLLWQEKGIETVEQLEAAAKQGILIGIPGFGEKSQARVLAGIEHLRQHRGRFKLSEADQLIAPLVEYMQETPELLRLEVAGSYRRRRETVGDIDLLAMASEAAPVMKRFIEYPGVARVEMSGETRGRVVLHSELEVDLRIVPPKSYGAALIYFTGSKEHNIKLRRRALERGLRLSEYGVFREDVREEESAAGEHSDADPWAGRQVAGGDESEVYSSIDLVFVEPEMREDRGEVEASAAGALPDLLELGDIRGDLQMHSTWSDGKNSIEEMMQACLARGYEYFALTDHSKALAMTGGLDAKRLQEQWREIEEIETRYPQIRLLRSLEVDILAEGGLDLEDEMLQQLDLVVVSVHSRFDLPARRQTDRILNALQHPAVDILAHPSGRIINRRAPFEFDLDEVLHCAKENRVAVELNAHPERLDLKDSHLILARELGVPVVISTDAHRSGHLDLMHYGVEQARRAWLTKENVLNTLPLKQFLEAFQISR